MSKLSGAKIAIVSPVASPGGIADYAENFSQAWQNSFAQVDYLANSDIERSFDTDLSIHRVWSTGEISFEKTLKWISENQPDILHIQYHPAFYPVTSLATLITEARVAHAEVRIFLTAHSIKSANYDLLEIRKALAGVEKIFAQSKQNVNDLYKAGIQNVVYFPLPYDHIRPRDTEELQKRLGLSEWEPVIATHGIITRHKGLLQTASAIAQLKDRFPNSYWLAVNALNKEDPDAVNTHKQLKQKIIDLALDDSTTLVTDFLDAPEISVFLQAADIGVIAYDEVGESASGAVRKFIASGISTIVADAPVMAEFNDEVYKIRDNSPEAIAQGIEHLARNPELRQELSQAAIKRAQSNTWEIAAEKLISEYSNQ